MFSTRNIVLNKKGKTLTVKKKIILPLTIGLLISSTNTITAQAEERNDNPTITENSYQEPGDYVESINNQDIVNTLSLIHI